jgi:hypothetical protein
MSPSRPVEAKFGRAKCVQDRAPCFIRGVHEEDGRSELSPNRYRLVSNPTFQ